MTDASAVDVDHQISAVRRTVSGRTHEAGDLSEVTVSQVYDATVEELWNAITTAERIERWFLPVTGDLRLGGTYQLEGNAGGEISACDPPYGFDATWVYRAEGMPEPGISWIEVRVAAEGESRARFTLTHVAQVDDGLWDQFGPGAVGIGWDQALIGLTLHLVSAGAKVDPGVIMSWMAGDEGRRFTTLAGEGWYAAEVASGEDEATARCHADATVAAYTDWGAEAAG